MQLILTPAEARTLQRLIRRTPRGEPTELLREFLYELTNPKIDRATKTRWIKEVS